MSNTTESPFSLTIKVGRNNDLLTGRADTVDEMKQRVDDLEVLAEHIGGKFVIGGSAPAPTTQQAVDNVKAATGPGTVVVGEEKEDRFGNKFYTEEGTGTCAHGDRIRAVRTSQEGEVYERFECVNNTPFRVGKYDKNAICKHAYKN
jgi:hypothetical protein